MLYFILSFLYSITDNLRDSGFAWTRAINCLLKVTQLTFNYSFMQAGLLQKYIHLAWPCPTPGMAYSKSQNMSQKSQLACE